MPVHSFQGLRRDVGVGYDTLVPMGQGNVDTVQRRGRTCKSIAAEKDFVVFILIGMDGARIGIHLSFMKATVADPRLLPQHASCLLEIEVAGRQAGRVAPHPPPLWLAWLPTLRHAKRRHPAGPGRGRFRSRLM